MPTEFASNLSTSSIYTEKAIGHSKCERGVAVRSHARRVTNSAWGSLKALIIQEVLPPQMDGQEKQDMAYQLVPHVMTKVFGAQNSGWHSFKAQSKLSGNMVQYIKKGPKPADK